MSEQAGSALGGPSEGEDAHGEAAITVGTVQGAHTALLLPAGRT